MTLPSALSSACSSFLILDLYANNNHHSYFFCLLVQSTTKLGPQIVIHKNTSVTAVKKGLILTSVTCRDQGPKKAACMIMGIVMKSNDKKTCHYFSLIADCIKECIQSRYTFRDKENWIFFFGNSVITLDNWSALKVTVLITFVLGNFREPVEFPFSLYCHLDHSISKYVLRKRSFEN